MRHCSCRRLRSLHAFPSRVQSRALAHHAGLEVPAGSTQQRTEKGSVQHQHLIVLFVLHYCKQEKWVLFASGKAEMKEWRSGGVTQQPINSGIVKSDGCTARKQWNTIVSMPFLSEHPNQRKKHAELVQFLWGKKWCLPISFKRNILQMCSPKSQADVTAIEKAIQKAPICSKTPDSLCLCHSAPWLHCSEHCFPPAPAALCWSFHPFQLTCLSSPSDPAYPDRDEEPTTLLSLWSKEGFCLSLPTPTLLSAAVVQTLHVVSIQHPSPQISA